MARALQFGLLFSLFKKCALPSLYEYFFKNDGEIWLVLKHVSNEFYDLHNI